MKVGVIGLGSMGKRRIRCLLKIKGIDIIGCDLRQDRRSEAEELYGISTKETFNQQNYGLIDALIICTPPDCHTSYLIEAIGYGLPTFVEASVLLSHVEKVIFENSKKGVLVAPSCTLRFHPLIVKIKYLVQNRVFGKVTNFSYHSGQYLPDWHPWEKVTDYYVSNPETGAAREIVPFELTWVVDVFGFPRTVKGFYGSTMDVGAPIDDTYAFSLKFSEGQIGNMIVDVASRFATRSLIINFEKGQLRWNWEDGEIKIFDIEKEVWQTIQQEKGTTELGYNQNIVEEMYLDELKAFIDAINAKSSFPNTLNDDLEVLKLLESIEQSQNKI